MADLNHRHRMAQYASRSSVELFTVLFFRNRTLDEQAHVIRVLRNAVVVLVAKYGLEGVVQLRVHGRANATTPFVLDTARHRLVAGALGVTLPLFGRITVQLSVEDETVRRQMRMHLALVQPAVPGVSVPPALAAAAAAALPEAEVLAAVTPTPAAVAPVRARRDEAAMAVDGTFSDDDESATTVLAGAAPHPPTDPGSKRARRP
jgi:hypothetical protein